MRRGSGVLLVLLMIGIITPTTCLTPSIINLTPLYERSYLIADDTGPSFTVT